MSLNQSACPNLSRNVSDPYLDIAPFELPNLIYASSSILILVIFSAILLDLEILVTFARRPRLINPFSIHMLNVTVINLLTAAIYDPILLLRNLGGREIFRGNMGLCGVYKYLQWTTIGMCAIQHCIICMDRWLAVLHSNWYRTKPIRFGVNATLIGLAYQQLWYLPLFLTDIVWVSAEANRAERLCDITRADKWLQVYQHVARCMTVLLPQGILVVSYPFLLYRIWGRTRVVGVAQQQQPQQQQLIKLGYRQRKAQSELRLALCSLALQIFFWMPFNVMSVLTNLRSCLPYTLDVSAFVYMFSTLLLILDPVVFLIFSVNMRREMRRHLMALLGKPVDADSTAFELTATRNSAL
ncbi:hypothetical protein BV898_18447 [Hypsibius exemplaris]|uniref:G-protein coupled receptors family 1 profile domain-containing protein n=1 Tax=Hypsibius exemplaris TaxID=2072580 RepID=A0A9X6NQ80_HYPEX|nr:hypothetical protein BV898_18447 [Hypsibius exemplaris]